MTAIKPCTILSHFWSGAAAMTLSWMAMKKEAFHRPESSGRPCLSIRHEPEDQVSAGSLNAGFPPHGGHSRPIVWLWFLAGNCQVIAFPALGFDAGKSVWLTKDSWKTCIGNWRTKPTIMLKIKEEKGNRDENTQEEVTHVTYLAKTSFFTWNSRILQLCQRWS